MSASADDAPMIRGAQIIAARALLMMQQSTLARRAGISIATLSALEQEASKPMSGTLAAIEAALAEAGIRFSPDGVRLQRWYGQADGTEKPAQVA